MGIDLGGIAKGYAIDAGLEALRRSRVKSAMITAGSTTAVYGAKPDGSSWRIGIENPRKPDEMIAVVTLAKGTVSTSGDYQNYFIRNGVRYHHILDPSTGRPVTGTMSASVIGDIDATRSDLLSTAVFVMGFEKAKRFVKKDGRLGIIFVTPDGHVRTAGNLKGRLSDVKSRL